MTLGLLMTNHPWGPGPPGPSVWTFTANHLTGTERNEATAGVAHHEQKAMTWARNVVLGARFPLFLREPLSGGVALGSLRGNGRAVRSDQGSHGWFQSNFTIKGKL